MSQLPVKKEPTVKSEPIDGFSPSSSFNGDATGRPSPSAASNGNTPNSNGNTPNINGSRSPVVKKEAKWQDIPLKCCTKAELDDIRYHILRFQTKQDVDINNNFTKPVRMHRKDPRNIQFQLTREEIDRRKRDQEARKLETDRAQEDEADSQAADEVDAASDAAKRNQADMSQVAPDGGARKPKKNVFKRKTKQINLMAEEKRKLRYEEYYPWVLEDYSGKNVFVGNYEAGSSDTQHVLFVFDKDGFKMVPAEKVYKFTPRNKYATLTLEEAEAKMEKNATTPRWLMKHMHDNSSSEGATPDMRFRHASTNGNAVVGGSSSRGRRMRTVTGGETNDRDSDHDDIDFDEEFADDEEAPIMDGDEEENKLSEKKIKREMMKAAHFDGQSDADMEEDDDLNDLFETEKSRKVDKEGKKLRKVLNKTEGGVYDSDDNEETNPPYVSQSDLESGNDSEDDDETKVKEEPNDSLSNEVENVRAFTARNVGDGFVVIKAPKDFLNGFPKGVWNPNVKKRQIETNKSPKKKAKLERDSTPSQTTSPQVKKEKQSVSPSPTPAATNLANVDLNSGGPNNEYVTVKEVLDIVSNNPLTTKELLVRLRNRVNAHKDNKQRIITIVKQTLKLVDGKLVLKDENR